MEMEIEMGQLGVFRLGEIVCRVACVACAVLLVVPGDVMCVLGYSCFILIYVGYGLWLSVAFGCAVCFCGRGVVEGKRRGGKSGFDGEKKGEEKCLCSLGVGRCVDLFHLFVVT